MLSGALPTPHLFIQNPLTGKFIDVLPLFEMMAERTHSSDGPQDLICRIQEVHDYVSTTLPCCENGAVNLREWADMSYTLVCFRKTFERMQEVPG